MRCLKDKIILLAVRFSLKLLLKNRFQRVDKILENGQGSQIRFYLVRCITIKIKIAYEAEIVKVVIEEETLTKHLQHTHTHKHARPYKGLYANILTQDGQMSSSLAPGGYVRSACTSKSYTQTSVSVSD